MWLQRNFQPFYSSSLWSKGHNASCKLTARESTRNQYHCTIHLASQILEIDGYRVSLQGNFFGRNHTYITFPEYNPREHSEYEPGQLWAEALPSSSGVRLMCSLTRSVSKTATENKWKQASLPMPGECAMWTSSVRMQSQCLSILPFPGLQRGWLWSTFQVYSAASCFLVPWIMYTWIASVVAFFLRNEVMRCQTQGLMAWHFREMLWYSASQSLSILVVCWKSRMWHPEWFFACRAVPRGWVIINLCQFCSCSDQPCKLILSTAGPSIAL